MKKIIINLVMWIGLVVIFVPQVKAADTYTANLTTTYTVNSVGQTFVDHKIDLINKTPSYYTSKYGLIVSSPNIKNVKVLSNGQVLNPEIVPSNNQTSIGITFPDEIVGEGKVRKVEISYADPDASVVSGKVLEVLVPQLGNSEDYDNYQVIINTPAQFGIPAKATPTNYETRQGGDQVVTTFNPQQGSSVTALFGQQQIFELRLRYHLNNTSPNPGIAQIALPPDTPFQKLDYQVLEPKPESLAADADGNWIATYEVPPQNRIDVFAVAKTLITLEPANGYPQTKPSDSLTSSQEFWESNTSTITQIADKLKSSKDIYNYVVKNLSYDYDNLNSEVPRLGAVQALANPTHAVCQEFADVFIALARAKRIPARRLTGYAYTKNTVLRPMSLNQDVLHAWPEYYDQATAEWRQADPTWGNTTGGVNYFDQFDLNHIVFAINGESSSLPYPAGAYKIPGNTDKDVEVVFAPDFPATKPDFGLTLQLTKVMGMPVPGQNKIILTNQGGQAWYNVTIDDSSNNLTLNGLPAQIPVILPYQTLTLPVSIYSNQVSFSSQSDLQLQMSYQLDDRLATEIPKQNQNGQPTSITIKLPAVKVSIGASYFKTLLNPASLVGLGVGCLVIAGLAGSLLVFGRRRSRALRRKSQKSKK